MIHFTAPDSTCLSSPCRARPCPRFSGSACPTSTAGPASPARARPSTPTAPCSSKSTSSRVSSSGPFGGAGAGAPPHTRGPPAPPRVCGAGSRRWGRACPAPPPAVVAAKQTRSPASHATSKRRVPARTHGGNGAGRKTQSRVCTRPARRSRGQGPHGAKRSAGRAGRDGCGPHGLRASAEAGSAECATDNSLAISLRISENLLPRPRSPWTCRNYHVLPNHGGWGEP